jgi:hypothetical protein
MFTLPLGARNLLMTAVGRLYARFLSFPALVNMAEWSTSETGMTSPSSLERSSVSTTVVLVAVIDTAGLEKRAGLARNDDEGVE